VKKPTSETKSNIFLRPGIAFDHCSVLTAEEKEKRWERSREVLLLTSTDRGKSIKKGGSFFKVFYLMRLRSCGETCRQGYSEKSVACIADPFLKTRPGGNERATKAAKSKIISNDFPGPLTTDSITADTSGEHPSSKAANQKRNRKMYWLSVA